ncbi:MAG TPA: caspase family protein [Candidatus Binataceae bacterium]|nr:caspase family protein [Candidatus Binataceae bacterium]
MTPLAESVAIILGASEWPKYPSFEAHKAFGNCTDFFRAYLFQHGLEQPNLLWLFDDDDQPGEINQKIVDFLRSKANSSIRNVLFYYVGHGGYRRNGDYFLALHCTSQTNTELTTLAVRHIAGTLKTEACDKRQIVILDACYAAGATRDFLNLDANADEASREVAAQVRESLPAIDIERGTSLFCAAGPKVKAKAPWESEYTMFSGALRRVLMAGNPAAEEFLSLQQLAVLVEQDIKNNFKLDAVRPEVHTPQQEKGDIRSLPFFPNAAWSDKGGSFKVRELQAELDTLKRRLGNVLNWEQEARRDGWYELLELRKELDQFGDLVQCHRIIEIHGPENGEISSIPYKFQAMPEYGTCVLESITDLQQGWSLEKTDMPPPAPVLEGKLRLKPVARANTAHQGFAVATRVINSFAMTTRESKLRKHPELEQTSIRGQLPARRLRLVVFWPQGYAPMDKPKITASVPNALDLSTNKWPEDRPEDHEETARVAQGFFYDKNMGCGVLNVEHALPQYHYVLSWKLPEPPTSQLTEAVYAREEVRRLLHLESSQRQWLNSRLEVIRDGVARRYLGWHENQPKTVKLSVFVFDQEQAAARIVAATFVPSQTSKFPWGTGVVGWAMRRRRPVFVDISDGVTAGIYRAVPESEERHLLCVPVPLPSTSDNRNELLLDPSVPCLVVSLSCTDDSGNLERLKVDQKLLGDVCSELVEKILDSMINLPV